MQNDNTGISIVDLFKVMYGRKLVCLFVTLGVVIASVLVVAFGYNMFNSTYVSNFNYNNTEINDGKYIDGSSFDYRSLASKEVLDAVKKSNSDFYSIDIDKMVEKGDVTIEIKYDPNAIKETYVQNGITYTNYNKKDMYYKVAIKKKYFKKETQAKDFIKALTEYPVSKTNTIAKNLNYNSNLNLYNSASSYETKIAYLKAQLDYLDTNYSNMIDLYGDSIVNDKKISTYKNEVDSYFSEYSLNDLEYELEAKGYVDVLSLASLHSQKSAIELQIAKIQSQIDSIEGQIERLLETINNSGVAISQLDLNVYNEKLLELNIAKVEENKKLEYINGQIANGESTDPTYLANKQAFEAKLTIADKKLFDFTDIYKENYNSVIDNNIYVFYTNTAIMKEEQGFSIIVTIILALVGGVIISGVVNLCIDHKKLTRKKEENVEGAN